MRSCRLAQAHTRRAIGYRSGICSRRLVAPTAVERFRQQDDSRTGLGGLTDVFHGASKVLFRLPTDHRHLRESEPEGAQFSGAVLHAA
jgi:hypothetical protein